MYNIEERAELASRLKKQTQTYISALEHLNNSGDTDKWAPLVQEAFDYMTDLYRELKKLQ